MKRLFITLSVLSLVLLLTPTHFSQAAELADRLKGKILLQVEDKGKAFYVDPTTKQRAYLGYPADAFRIMRELGLGIKHDELQGYLDAQFPKRLSGKILLDVESRGEAYYVFPDDLKGYYLGKPADAFRVMREKGLGIKNEDLAEVPVFQKYKEQVEKLAKKIEQIEGGGQVLGEEVKKQSDVISKQQEQIIDLQKQVKELAKQPTPIPTSPSVPTLPASTSLAPSIPTTPAVPATPPLTVTPTPQEQIGTEQKAIEGNVTCAFSNAYSYLRCSNSYPDLITVTGVDVSTYGSTFWSQEVRAEIWDEKNNSYISGYYNPRYDYSIIPQSSVSNINPLEDKKIITWIFTTLDGLTNLVTGQIKEIRYTINGETKKAIIK